MSIPGGDRERVRSGRPSVQDGRNPEPGGPGVPLPDLGDGDGDAVMVDSDPAAARPGFRAGLTPRARPPERPLSRNRCSLPCCCGVATAGTPPHRRCIYGAIRRLWGLLRSFVSAAGQDAVELVAGADVELSEDLVQVVFDRARADEQLGGDLGVGQAVTG